jgi:hypothetical protein
MEAQRYLDDYDGIVAGAPAAAWTRFMPNFIWNVQALADSKRAGGLPGRRAAVNSFRSRG